MTKSYSGPAYEEANKGLIKHLSEQQAKAPAAATEPKEVTPRELQDRIAAGMRKFLGLEPEGGA